MTTTAEIASVLADHLDVDPRAIDDGTRFLDLPDWDSVHALKVFMDLETVVGGRLPIKAFLAAETVGEVRGLLLQRAA